jgi:hypothetical protein
MGRPRNEKRKGKAICIRVTEEDADRVGKRAQEAGLTVSEYVWSMASVGMGLNTEPWPKVEFQGRATAVKKKQAAKKTPKVQQADQKGQKVPESHEGAGFRQVDEEELGKRVPGAQPGAQGVEGASVDDPEEFLKSS